MSVRKNRKKEKWKRKGNNVLAPTDRILLSSRTGFSRLSNWRLWNIAKLVFLESISISFFFLCSLRFLLSFSFFFVFVNSLFFLLALCFFSFRINFRKFDRFIGGRRLVRIHVSVVYTVIVGRFFSLDFFPSFEAAFIGYLRYYVHWS